MTDSHDRISAAATPERSADPDRSADERDAAAARRDVAADTRDAVATAADPHDRVAGDRLFAAQDRAFAVTGRETAAARDVAEVAGEKAAEVRDTRSALLEKAAHATGQRAAAGIDRQITALVELTATMQRITGLGSQVEVLCGVTATLEELRNGLLAGLDDGLTQANGRLLAAQERAISVVFRAEAAVHAAASNTRDEAAQLRDTASADDDGPLRAAEDRRLAAADRTAAALDRNSAAMDRLGAWNVLQTAYRDSLTGTLVRSAGREQLSYSIDRAHRSAQPLVFAFLDVDRLKQLNDKEGHVAGDRCLRAVAGALINGLRSYDLVVRYGGDEFLCALPGSRLADAQERFTRISQLLRDDLAGTSISVGLAELREHEHLDQLIDRADRNMYEQRAVASGRTVDGPDATPGSPVRPPLPEG